MQKSSHLKYLLVVVCIALFANAVNAGSLNTYLVGTNHFFDMFPAEKVLTDQFSARVNSPPSPISIFQPRPARITIVSSSDSRLNDRFFKYSFEKRLQELHINYRLKSVSIVKGNRQSLSELLENIIEGTPDYVVFDQLSPLQLPIIEKMLKRDRPKVIFRNMATPVKSWINHSPLLYAGINEKKSMDRLASYLARQIPSDAKIDALIANGDAIAQRRCNNFFDALQSRGVQVRWSIKVENSVRAAREAALELIHVHPAPYFIFGCTTVMSQGIVKAIQSDPAIMTTTNSWGEDRIEIEWLSKGYVSVVVLPSMDNVAIAIAEALKNELNSDPVPKLYLARTSILTQDMDTESANLMFQQSYQYASSLWQ